jgi:hypothetical protein
LNYSERGIHYRSPRLGARRSLRLQTIGKQCFRFQRSGEKLREAFLAAVNFGSLVLVSNLLKFIRRHTPLDKLAESFTTIIVQTLRRYS